MPNKHQPNRKPQPAPNRQQRKPAPRPQARPKNFPWFFGS